MFAHPDSAATARIVETVGINRLLYLFKAEVARIFRSHLVARCLDHKTEFTATFRRQRGGMWVFIEPRKKNSNFGNTGCVLTAVRMNHRQARRSQVQQSNRTLRTGYVEAFPQLQVDRFQPALQPPIDRW